MKISVLPNARGSGSSHRGFHLTAEHLGFYLDVIFQLVPPLLLRFDPQVGAPFAREVRCLDDLSELQEPKDTPLTIKSENRSPTNITSN